LDRLNVKLSVAPSAEILVRTRKQSDQFIGAWAYLQSSEVPFVLWIVYGILRSDWVIIAANKRQPYAAWLHFFFKLRNKDC
jgi:hypothetical protein